MDASCGDNTRALNSKKWENYKRKPLEYHILAKQCSIFKEMHKLKILKLKHFITFQNILFINNCLDEERMKSFNKTLLINTINTHQLKRCGFKREKYGYFPILSKCLSDWNLSKMH